MVNVFASMEVGDQIIVQAKHKDGSVFAEYDSLKDRSLAKKLMAQIRFRLLGKKTYNSMTNAGFAAIGGLISGVGGVTAFTQVGLGTGSTAAAPADTTLGTQIARKAVVPTLITTTVANDTIQYNVVYSSADTLAGTSVCREVGIFNAASNGTMMLRQVFGAITMNWDEGDNLNIVVKVKSQQGA